MAVSTSRMFRRPGVVRGLLWARTSAAVLLAVLAVSSSPAFAQNGTWTGATSGTWPTNTNWASNTIAGATNSTTNTGVATFNSATPTNATLTIDATRNIRSLLFTGSAAAFTIGSGGANGGETLRLSSGGSITVSTTSTLTALQTVNAPLQIQSANGTYTFDGSGGASGSLLLINGNVSAAAAGTSSLALQGSNTGTNTVSGIIGNGSATTFNVSKSGAGQWVLAGSNTYNGSTSVTAGTLTLAGANGAIANSSGIEISRGATFRIDNTALNNSDRVGDSVAITLNGGGLTFATNTTAGSFSEALGALNLNTLVSTLTTNQAASGQTSALTFASLNRSAGAGINFVGTAGNSQNRILFGTAPTLNNGIMGPWATWNGSGYAAYDATNGVVTATYTAINAQGSTIADSGTANVQINAAGSGGDIALASTTTAINTLLQATTTAATVATASRTLRLNGIMVGASQQALTIGAAVGDGTLTAATPGGELVLNANSTNSLRINAAIADNESASSLTKTGGNTLILAANNTYTGTTTVAQGTLQIGSSTITGSVGGDVRVLTGATLAYNRTNSSSPIGGSVIGAGGAITVNSGTFRFTAAPGANTFSSLTVGSGRGVTIDGAAGANSTFTSTSLTNNANSVITLVGGSNSLAGNFWPTGNAVRISGGTNLFPGSGQPLILNYSTGTTGLSVSGGTTTIATGLRNGRSSGITMVDVSGGTLTIDGDLYNDGAGVTSVVNVTGGTLGFSGVRNYYASGSAARSELNVSGGSFGTLAAAPNIRVANNALAAMGVVNLRGGVMYAQVITSSAPTVAFVNFDGGTLAAASNQSAFWPANQATSYVYGGGATIDDSGFAITIAQPLLAPTGQGVTALPSLPGGELSGYLFAPYVSITGGSGIGATAMASFDAATGKVTGLTLTNPGVGYLAGDTVNVTLKGGAGSGIADVNLGSATLGTNQSGGLTKTGTGALTLTGANTYTGPTAINAGRVIAGVTDVAGVSGALGNGGAISFGGGTLQYAAASAGTDYSSRIRNSGSAISIDLNGRSPTFANALDSTNTGGLVISDTNTAKGTLTLAAANTFSGTTTVTSGTLRLSNSLALQNSVLGSGGTGIVFDSAVTERAFTLGGLGGNGNLALADSAANAITLTVGNGDLSSSYSGALSGAGSLRKIGTGTLTLSGNNSHAGGTVISAGTLRRGSATALGASTASLAVNGGTLDMNGFSETVGSLSGSSGAVITSAAAATLTVSSTATSQFDGTISGAVGLSKLGTGTLILGGSNSMGPGTMSFGGSGTNAGYIRLTNADALGGYTAVSLNGSNTGGVSGLELSGNITVNKTLLTAGRANVDTTGYILRNISGSNTWSGPITINQTGGSYGIVSDADLLTISSTISSTVDTSLNTARSFTFAGNGDIAISGRIVDTSGTSLTTKISVTKSGAGTLTLSGSNTYSQGTTLQSGAVAAGDVAAFGTGTVTFSGGAVVRPSVSGTFANAIAINAGVTGTFDTNGMVSGLSGVISGSGGFTKGGLGTLTLSGNNTHSGGTIITAGTLQLGSATALGASTAALAVHGGTLDMNGFSETIGTLSGSSGAVITSAATATLTGSSSANSQFDGVISGAVALTKQGAGTLTLAGVNTYTGTTTISGGALALGSGASIGSSSSALVISSAAALRIGSGATVNTSGTMRLSGTGAIYLESGGIFNATQSGGSVQFVADATTSSTNAGILTSSGGVGTSGTMSVTASFLRPAGVNNGRYTFTFDNTIVSATGATFEVGRGGSYNTVTLTNGAQINASAATVAVDASYYTLNVNDGSTLTLRNNTLSLKGGGGSNQTLNINGGTISNASALSFGGAADSVVNITNGGLLSTNANSTISATNAVVSVSGTGSHWNMNGRTLGLGGAGVESNTVRLSNGGQLTAASVSIAAGGNALEFDGGLLASATTGTLLSGAGAVRIKAGGATINTGSFTSTISANLSGDSGSTGGGLAKLGSGRLSLLGSNSYTGSTLISGGTLALGSAASLASGTIRAGLTAGDGGTLDVTALGSGLQLASGQTLGGYGSVLGDVVVGSGAIVAPGGSIGTLTESGTQTWAAGGTFLFEITDANGVAGTGWDMLDVAGLQITAHSGSGNQFIIDLQTLTAATDQVAGPMSLANWDPSASYQWKFVVADAAITSFDATAFTLDTTAFQNTVNGGFSVARGDQVGGLNTELYIVYSAVPEPGTLALAGIGAVIVCWTLRHRRRG